MNRVSIAAAFAVALIQSTYAVRVAEEANDEDFGFSNLDFGEEEGLESKEEDIASAFYFDPEEQVIYEVLTDEELAAQKDAEALAATVADAADVAANTQKTISGDAANFSAADLVKMGLL